MEAVREYFGNLFEAFLDLSTGKKIVISRDLTDMQREVTSQMLDYEGDRCLVNLGNRLRVYATPDGTEVLINGKNYFYRRNGVEHTNGKDRE